MQAIASDLRQLVTSFLTENERCRNWIVCKSWSNLLLVRPDSLPFVLTLEPVTPLEQPYLTMVEPRNSMGFLPDIQINFQWLVESWMVEEENESLHIRWTNRCTLLVKRKVTIHVREPVLFLIKDTLLLVSQKKTKLSKCAQMNLITGSWTALQATFERSPFCFLSECFYIWRKDGHVVVMLEDGRILSVKKPPFLVQNVDHLKATNKHLFVSSSCKWLDVFSISTYRHLARLAVSAGELESRCHVRGEFLYFQNTYEYINRIDVYSLKSGCKRVHQLHYDQYIHSTWYCSKSVFWIDDALELLFYSHCSLLLFPRCYLATQSLMCNLPQVKPSKIE